MSSISLIKLTTAFMALAMAVLGADPPYGQLSIKGTQLVGSNGQAVALHGMSLFWHQWMPQYFNADTVQALKCKWNANVVRAVMGVEEGGYLSNPTDAMARVEAVVKAAIDLGIYVIIDWHDHNAQNHPDKAVDFFTKISSKYGSYKNIIYETFNEPLGVSWTDVLKPYHQKVIAAIRANDKNNVIILGTPTWSQDVDVASQSPITGFSNIAYTLHYYAASHKESLQAKLKTAVNNGIAVFVTEYGTTEASGDGTVDSASSNTWWNILDQMKISYLNWAIEDKSESSAALTPGTTAQQVGDSSRWTTSGKLVQAKLASQNNGVSCSGSGSVTTTTTKAGGTTTTTKASGTTTTTKAPSGGGGSSGSGSGVSISAKKISSWNNDADTQYNLEVTNKGSQPVCSVRFKLTLASGQSVSNKWNMQSTSSGNVYNMESWLKIAAGATNKDTGFIVSGGSSPPQVSVVSSGKC